LGDLMGKCPCCGSSYLLSTPTEKCGWCGRVVCKKCVLKWPGYFLVKSEKETEEKGAKYQMIGFCSEFCSNSFWDTIMKYPCSEIGTDINEFSKNLRKLYYIAVLNALNGNPVVREQAINRVKWAMSIETDICKALPLGIHADGTWGEEAGDIHRAFGKHGYLGLAANLEKCGRPLDAAEIYEKHLKMYDKARQLREKDKQVTVKRTEVSINLNELLKQIRDGGIVAIYRCPHCNGTLKVNDKTSLKSLKTCEHCGSEIETVDLADFLKTAIS